jgi:hypothetical protein
MIESKTPGTSPKLAMSSLLIFRLEARISYGTLDIVFTIWSTLKLPQGWRKSSISSHQNWPCQIWWELIDDFLQPWGSFKVDQIVKTIQSTYVRSGWVGRRKNNKLHRAKAPALVKSIRKFHVTIRLAAWMRDLAGEFTYDLLKKRIHVNLRIFFPLAEREEEGG